MLLKASKDCRAHKMRNVKLIEADCNLNYKKIGKEGMQNGRKLGCSVQRMVEAGNTTEPKKFHWTTPLSVMTPGFAGSYGNHL